MSNGYIVIENTPGYLPESDPLECDTLEEAKECLLEQVERSCEFLDEVDDLEYTVEIASDGMSAFVSQGGHHLGRSFEVAPG